jgi:hypothetical protein
MSAPEQSWQLYSAQVEHNGYVISVRVNSRYGLPGWLIDVHITSASRLVASDLRASTHATSKEALDFGIELARALVDSFPKRS